MLAPDVVIFTPDRVRGLAVCGDVVATSASLGSADSELAVYRTPLDGHAIGMPWGRAVIPAYSLDADARLTTTAMPAGAQDLEWRGGRLLTVFEGGADAYRDRWRAAGGCIEDRLYVLALPAATDVQGSIQTFFGPSRR